jgi:hypothetical protein
VDDPRLLDREELAEYERRAEVRPSLPCSEWNDLLHSAIHYLNERDERLRVNVGIMAQSRELKRRIHEYEHGGQSDQE